MRTSVYLLIAVVFISVLFSSCDKIERPHTQTSGGNPNTSDTLFRKILIEDYTGSRCGSCPPAAVMLYDQLAPLYGENLITIGVHASYLSTYTNPIPPALPLPDMPAGSFPTDFRTPAGEAWLAFFNVDANPKGMVSRQDFSTNQHVKSYSAWGAAALSVFRQPAKFQVEITNQYDSASGNLDCNVKVKALQAVSGTYNLSVVLTEDSVIDWQTWYNHTPKYVPDYIHRHVLRGALNGTFGDQVFTGVAAVNDSVVSPYTLNLQNITSINPVNPSLNINHCHIVAFVFDATSREIWQVEEEKVQ